MLLKSIAWCSAVAIFIFPVSMPVWADDYCFVRAGQYYDISPELLRAISYVESNHNQQAINKNKNGTADYCHMQINTCWQDMLGERWDYLSNPCYCTYVGAWILKQCMIRYGYTWDAVACYNSNKALNELSGEKRERVEKHVSKVIKAIYGE